MFNQQLPKIEYVNNNLGSTSLTHNINILLFPKILATILIFQLYIPLYNGAVDEINQLNYI